MGIKNFVTASLAVFVVAVVVIFGAWTFFQQPKTTNAPEAQNTNVPETNNNSSATKTFTAAELAAHSTESDCWVAISGKVYNVTTIIPTHPGGPEAIVPFCGKDATVAFQERAGKGPHPEQAQNNLANYYEGELAR